MADGREKFGPKNLSERSVATFRVGANRIVANGGNERHQMDQV